MRWLRYEADGREAYGIIEARAFEALGDFECVESGGHH